MAARPLSTADVGVIKSRTLRISLFAIASVFVFEFVAGILTNSLALLTDSTHALLDVVVTLVLIIATTLAIKPRDKDHTYGHGKIETVGGFIGGAALFVVAVFFIYEAIFRIAVSQSPGAVLVRPGMIGFAAVAYTLAVDVFRIAILLRAARKTEAATIRADLYHSFADFASTIVALIGLWLVTVGFLQGDSAAAIVLGGVLAYLSIRFVYQNAIELTDVISPRLVAVVRNAASDTEGVLECKDVKVRRVGREIFVDVTVSLRGHMSFEAAHGTSDLVEVNIAKGVAEMGLIASPGGITVHFEPLTRGGTLDSIVEYAARRVEGVMGVHNILISRVEGADTVEVSLHIQVRRDASLSEAHSISNAVENSIKQSLKGADNITVHLEPNLPELEGVHTVTDEVEKSVREAVLASTDIERVGKIVAYGADRKALRIDVECVFKSSAGEMTIEQVHERVSEIEKRIRDRYPGSIVTIHAEPAS